MINLFFAKFILTKGGTLEVIFHPKVIFQLDVVLNWLNKLSQK
jgi:hypothetical protein